MPRTCQTVYGSTNAYMKCHLCLFSFSSYMKSDYSLRNFSCHHQAHQSSVHWYWAHICQETINMHVCVSHFASRLCTFPLSVKFQCICLISSKQSKWLIPPFSFILSKPPTYYFLLSFKFMASFPLILLHECK